MVSPVPIVGNFVASYIGGARLIRGSDGTAWAWGRNIYGQLGDNTRTSKSSPVSVLGGNSYIQIAAGVNHSLAIRGSDGTAWAWGHNTYGQLGDNTTASKSSPVSVLGGNSYTQIAAGYYYSLAIRGSDGSAWAWGDNNYGQLGDNTTASKSSPVSVLGGNSYIQIAAGYYYSLAIRGSDGSAWAWGYNEYGQLGDNTTAGKSSPVSVLGGNSYIQIAAGTNHSLAIRGSDGTAWAWGDNI
jgi:alpha-tubulin suppressor-like RCC1 family protein